MANKRNLKCLLTISVFLLAIECVTASGDNRASNPSPADGASHGATWANLTWSAGDTAVSHDVYFGDNFADVDAGTGDTFRGNQTETFFVVGFVGFPYPAGLVAGTTYYWRIDEFDAVTTHKGDVWRFTTMPVLVDIDATGANNGTSWADAYKYLQDALAVAQGGDQIWVAEGTYKPDANTANPSGTGERSATFQLMNGVTIKGGYAGYGAADPDARDVELYETILSGDINTPGDNWDNSYHVVTGSGTEPNAVLDGFTSTAGNANSPAYPNDRGGGMYNDSGSPTVTNCTFVGNTARNYGGGMSNYHSSPTLINCTFSGNSAFDYGGGMYNTYSSPTVTSCTFSGNSADWGGGGMRNMTGSAPNLTDCTFSGNSTEVYGGGMSNYNNGNPTVMNCTFRGNTASSDGGGMSNYHSSPTLTNCTFSGNSATYDGGGMYNNDSSPTVTNCTFSGNSAGSEGGGMYNELSSNPTLTNCIMWGDSAPSGPEIFNDGPPTPTVTYSDIAGGYGGTGNIATDPLFVDANGLDDIVGTEDDNLHLLGYSPCINGGDPSGDYSGQVDLDGKPRVAYGRVDVGADEVFPAAGDFEPDGDVDFVDFAIFAGNWLLGVE